MTDIVMRARVRATMLRGGKNDKGRIIGQPVSAIMTATLLDELADEIERLRKDLDGEYAINGALNGVNRSLKAEIERLRAISDDAGLMREDAILAFEKKAKP